MKFFPLKMFDFGVPKARQSYPRFTGSLKMAGIRKMFFSRKLIRIDYLNFVEKILDDAFTVISEISQILTSVAGFYLFLK